MDSKLIFDKYFKPSILEYLEAKNTEYMEQGLIPTLELLIDELKNENNT